ncbi:MAG: hypothetical protein WCD11_27960, partial [Solirubrobacteraceae bacterium]
MQSAGTAVPTALAGAAAKTRFPAALSDTHAAMMDAVLDGDGIERVAELAAAAVGGPIAVVIPGSRV